MKRLLNISIKSKVGLIAGVPLCLILLIIINFVDRTTIEQNLSVILLFSIFLLIFIQFLARNISEQIAQISNGVRRISKAEYDTPIHILSSDENGDIASELNKLATSLSKTTQMAKRIASGEFNQNFKVDDESNQLNLAFKQMTSFLSQNKLFLEEEKEKLQQQDWINSKYAEITDALQAPKENTNFADTLLHIMASVFEIHIGLYYEAFGEGVILFNEDELSLILKSSYAFKESDHLSSQYSLGEGLVGQCASERKIIYLKNVPANYVHISSGVGQSAPAEILLFPIVFEDQLLSVIEVGSMTGFSEKHRDLVCLLKENLGVILNNIQSRFRTEGLLSQSQEQSRELMQQHEVLQDTHSQLELQAQQLRESEDILKVQREKLQASNSELEERQEILVQQKNEIEVAKREIEKSAEELALASKYKSEFLANMSHELRTPLNSLILLSKGLYDNKTGNLTPDQMEDAEVIYEGGYDLLELINDILDLSKVEAGKLDVNIDEIELKSLSRNLHRLFDPVANNKGLVFSVKFSEDLPTSIYSDRQRIEQILKNLLSNALKFTEAGSVTVNISRCEPEVVFSDKRLSNSDAVSISVTDTGVGIPESKQLAIFGAFQQQDGSTNRKYGGTGLGLTISKELSRLLGGEIHLKSQEGIGSTFTFHLPTNYSQVPSLEAIAIDTDRPDVTHTSAATQPVVSSSDSEMSQSVYQFIPDDHLHILDDDNTILIIESNQDTARNLRDFARKNKYKCLVSSHGRHGVVLAETFQPDGILINEDLIDIEGHQVLEQLKHNLNTRHIPVYFFCKLYEPVKLRSKGVYSSNVYVNTPNGSDIAPFLTKISELKTNTERVIVILSAENSAPSIKDKLSCDNINVITTSDSKDAYRLTTDEQVSCVLMHPDFLTSDNFDFLSSISAHEQNVIAPIIVVAVDGLDKLQTARVDRFNQSLCISLAHSNDQLLERTTLYLHSQEFNQSELDPLIPIHEEIFMLKQRRILLVDGDMRNTFALSKKLLDLEVEVDIAKNGNEAIALMNENSNYELVLIDLLMPTMNGYETTKHIRQIDNYQNIPVIAMTTKAMQDDRSKCLEVGVSEYFVKPVDFDQLRLVLQTWLFTYAEIESPLCPIEKHIEES